MQVNIRQDWTLDEVHKLYHTPLLDLVFQAAGIHRRFHDAREVQTCTLLSVKTGGCPEDCAYCPQSAHHQTDVVREKLLDTDAVLEHAQRAKQAGSTRFCMGAAWRQVKDGRDFEEILKMVRGVRELGMEACCTLGMLTAEQARRLKAAGLSAYNHNLDTSETFYPNIIGTRTYEDRLTTLRHVADAGISICCGGIIGMGESEADRIDLLHRLATHDPQPESVPVNTLVPVAGTPLEQQQPVSAFEFVRAIAVARVLMPKAMVRLSAGRLSLSAEAQALAFLAGANSIFTGERLLTTPNPEHDIDQQLLGTLGLSPRPPDKDTDEGAAGTAQPQAQRA